MRDLLLSVLAAAVLVTVGLAALAALTLVPFVVALQAADARCRSTARWGAAALAGSIAALAVALGLLVIGTPPAVAALVAAALAWTVPAVLWRAGRGARPLGAHQ